MLFSRSLRLALFALGTLLTGIWVRTCHLPPEKRVRIMEPANAPRDLDPHRPRNPDE
ncbi:MAG: hypothetical protein HS117_14160 [Verrucomicrobiaceae bacterium]|jgi:hypothetical protein|nr:hypothetical protein [Verrucomicrobiaceae bacterium]